MITSCPSQLKISELIKVLQGIRDLWQHPSEDNAFNGGEIWYHFGCDISKKQRKTGDCLKSVCSGLHLSCGNTAIPMWSRRTQLWQCLYVQMESYDCFQTFLTFPECIVRQRNRAKPFSLTQSYLCFYLIPRAIYQSSTPIPPTLSYRKWQDTVSCAIWNKALIKARI